MNAKDQSKVLDAGFTIIRKEGENTFSNKKIKYKNSFHKDWTTLQKDFKSNAEMNRKMQVLLKQPMTIED